MIDNFRFSLFTSTYQAFITNFIHIILYMWQKNMLTQQLRKKGAIQQPLQAIISNTFEKKRNFQSQTTLQNY